jgi:hypothetical protein
MKTRLRLVMLALPLLLTSCWGPCDPGVLGVFMPAPKISNEEKTWRERVASVQKNGPLEDMVSALGLSKYEFRDEPNDAEIRVYFVEGGWISIACRGKSPKTVVDVRFAPYSQLPSENLVYWEKLRANKEPNQAREPTRQARGSS